MTDLTRGISMKSQNIVAGAFAGLFLLAGCTGQELHNARLIEPQGSEFNQNLYRGYIGLSEAEYAEGDYSDSDVFAIRATTVGTNGNVGPVRRVCSCPANLNTTFKGDLTASRYICYIESVIHFYR